MKYILFTILLILVTGCRIQATSAPVQKGGGSRVIVRNDMEKLLNQKLSLDLKEVSLAEALASIAKQAKVPLLMDEKFEKRPDKITVLSSGMKLIQVLYGLAAEYKGAWVRKGKGFCLVSIWYSDDPVENALSKMQTALDCLSTDSSKISLNAEDRQRLEQIRSELRYFTAPWSSDLASNSIVSRKEEDQMTMWGVSIEQESQIGGAWQSNAYSKWWSYTKPTLKGQ